MTDDPLASRQSQWFKGVLDLCVLGVLGGAERYGYEMAGLLNGAGLGPIKGGTLYPLLARLENESLVTSKWKPSELGPERKYYALTAEGRALLDTAVPLWQEFMERAGKVMGGNE